MLVGSGCRHATKHHTWGAVNNRNLFLHRPGAGNFGFWDILRVFQLAAFWLCSYVTGREVVVSPPLIRTAVLLDWRPTLMTSFTLNYPLKALSPNTTALGVRARTQELGGGEAPT